MKTRASTKRPESLANTKDESKPSSQSQANSVQKVSKGVSIKDSSAVLKTSNTPSVQKQLNSSPDMRKKSMSGVSRSSSPERIKIRLGSFVQKHDKVEEYLTRFASKERLGSGHYSEVFRLKGKEGEPNRAMKIIDKKKIPFNEKETFLREIELLKRLDHPNILKLYEFLEDEGCYYLITELCEGVELFDVIQDNCETLTEKDIASIVQQILQSLTYAHTNKIMHRDIKPENIMVHKDDEDNYTIKIVDWGIGSDFSSNDSTLNMKCGTPYYAAPEVIKKKYNEKCDIWSTGVILYTLLVQDTPFGGDSTTDIILNVLKGQYTMNVDDWSKVSDDAKDLVKKLLCYDYNARISAEEALKHPWFKKVSSVSKLNKNVLKMNMKKLQQFKAQSQLQRAAMSFIVSHLVNDKDKEKYLKVFKELDENGDGMLSKQEIKNAYNGSTGRIMSDEEIDGIFLQIDTDQSGFIDYTEFVTAVIDANVFTEQERLRNAFNLFDKDGDGFITSVEIQNVLGIGGIELDKQTWQSIVAEVDENGDGQISFEEFCKIMKSLVQETSNPRKKKQSVSKQQAE